MKLKFNFFETSLFVLCVGVLCVAATPIKDLFFQSNVNANGYSITNLASPTNSSDAATKNYVDSSISSHPTTNASSLTSGTLADGRLSSNVALLNSSNVFSANQTVNAQFAANRLLIGGDSNDIKERLYGTNYSMIALGTNSDSSGDVWNIGMGDSSWGRGLLFMQKNGNSYIETRFRIFQDGLNDLIGDLTVRASSSNGALLAKPGNISCEGKFIGSGAGLTDRSVSSSALAVSPNFRNRIVNGAMKIDQRNGGNAQIFTAAAANAYCVDRFYVSCTGANITGQRITSGESGFQYAYRLTGASGNTATLLGQRVEASSVSDLAGSVATLSVYLKSSSITAVTWKVYYANSADTFSGKTQIASGTFTISSSLSRYSTNITLPSYAANGVAIEFSTGALTSGNTLTITGIQFEAGAGVSIFEQLPIGMELSLCQRYFQKDVRAEVETYSAAGSNCGTRVYFKQTMRVVPSINGLLLFWADNISGANTARPHVDGITVYGVTGSSGHVFGAWSFDADAEL